MDRIHKVAAVVIEDNRFLMVRKVGKETWTSLGGHLEAGETEEECLHREIKEELDCDAEIIRKIGDYENKAIHHNNIELLISVYLVKLKGEPKLVDEELEEFRFLTKEEVESKVKLPPSITDQIIPKLKKQRLLEW